jgi:peptide/nickel transport system substrate-binding protein
MRDPQPDPEGQALTRREFLSKGLRLAALAALAPGSLSLLLSGCGGTRKRLGEELVRGSLAVALDADVQTLDPAMHRSRTVEAVVRNICDGLVTRDARMQYVPELAVGWEVQGEDRWVFTLREGVKFSIP